MTTGSTLPPAGRLHLRAAPGDGREARVRGASADVQGRDRCDGRAALTPTRRTRSSSTRGARRARSRSPTRFFRDALAWRFAAILAPALAHVDPLIVEQRGRGPEDPHDKAQRAADRAAQIRQSIAGNAWAQYRIALGQARVPNANEQQPDLHFPDAPWIVDRT